MAQEGFHFVKVKKIPSIMNIDRAKSNDKASWNFLRLVLLQIGLSLEVTNWIMGHVSLKIS